MGRGGTGVAGTARDRRQAIVSCPAQLRLRVRLAQDLLKQLNGLYVVSATGSDVRSMQRAEKHPACAGGGQPPGLFVETLRLVPLFVVHVRGREIARPQRRVGVQIRPVRRR